MIAFVNNKDGLVSLLGHTSTQRGIPHNNDVPAFQYNSGKYVWCIEGRPMNPNGPYISDPSGYKAFNVGPRGEKPNVKYYITEQEFDRDYRSN